VALEHAARRLDRDDPSRVNQETVGHEMKRPRVCRGLPV
jgi:hypothetical protein